MMGDFMGRGGLEEHGFMAISELLHSGIYALTWKGDVVYIGQTERLYQRLYTHCSNKVRHRQVQFGKKVIRGAVFDGVWILPCAVADLNRVEQELIGKFNPCYNEHHRTTKISVGELLQALGRVPPTKQSPTGNYIQRRL